ncbi:MAG TPA: amidohydrolase/deacetylase family metallohydrolase [Puia sp.]|jgi:dihydroorotase|nr:amidohydrolase/deacetylase family metallohydrolase [Puia sp.]
MKKSVILLLLFFQLQLVFAQKIELLIKGGHVVDPKNNIDGILDVAVNNGRILKIAKGIDAHNALHVVNARGMIVVPGLIDIHTHDFYGPDPERHFCNGSESILPDSFAFRTGITTVVDAGSSGWRDFPDFKKKIIDGSKTRVFAFLNIVGAGMRGRKFEQDTDDMDGKKTAMIAQQYHDYIVGIKLAHYKGAEWKPVEEAIKAGSLANIPLMIDFGDNKSPLSLEELLLKRMRSGDIFTHCFAELKGREYIVDTGSKKIKPYVWEARKKGILFDVGYGEISFSFSQAIPAIESGFYPNSISTDMHAARRNKNKDMPEIISEFLALGMNLREVIERVTWNPAREIHHKELGNLSKGAIADIAILHVRKNDIKFYDHAGYQLSGSKSFECEMTIKSGKIVYDRKSLL